MFYRSQTVKEHVTVLDLKIFKAIWGACLAQLVERATFDLGCGFKPHLSIEITFKNNKKQKF